MLYTLPPAIGVTAKPTFFDCGHVSKPPNVDGTSWATAFYDLHLALEHAAAGSRIWVAKKIYPPTNGPEQFAAFVMKKGGNLYCGFNGTETKLKQRGWKNDTTALSGDIGRLHFSSTILKFDLIKIICYKI